MESLRKPAVAGQFYPSNPEELRAELERLMKEAESVGVAGKIRALVVPHAGYVYSGQTAAWGYRQVEEQWKQTEEQINHLVLIGPAHFERVQNLAADSHQVWLTPLGKVRQVVGKTKVNLVEVNDQAHEGEHSLEVQLPFLQALWERLGKKGEVTCLVTGGRIKVSGSVDYLQANYPDSLLIISTDLSHYLPLEWAEEIDRKTIEAIEKLDLEYFNQQENAACGHEGLKVGLETARRNNWQVKITKYDTSATAFGDTSRVVGYLSAVFYER